MLDFELGDELSLLVETARSFAAEGAAVVVNDLGATMDGSGVEGTPAEEVTEEICKAGGKAVALTCNSGPRAALGPRVRVPDGPPGIPGTYAGSFGHVTSCGVSERPHNALARIIREEPGL